DQRRLGEGGPVPIQRCIASTLQRLSHDVTVQRFNVFFALVPVFVVRSSWFRSVPIQRCNGSTIQRLLRLLRLSSRVIQSKDSSLSECESACHLESAKLHLPSKSVPPASMAAAFTL